MTGKTKESQLQVIVSESGLEKTKAQHILENFQDYFKIASEWEKKARMIKVTDESQEAEMKMARTGRLYLREKRIAVEKARKELKEQALREGKAIDGIANVLKALIVPLEKYLHKQEKFVDIKKEKEREAARQEAERKAEEEKLENERLDKLADKRREEALPYTSYWREDYNFRAMSEAEFNSAMKDLKKQKADHDKEQERIRKENERLQKEAEERERKAKEEKERIEKERAEEKAKVEAEKKKAEEKAREERERIEKEHQEKLRAEQEKAKKVEAELKAKEEAEKKKAEEEKKRIEAQKRASDKDKLLYLAEKIEAIEYPQVKSEKSEQILSEVKILLEKAQGLLKTGGK
jgi:hypothetical protein